MFVITVFVEAVAGREDALEDALLTHAQNTLREEAACLRFDVAKDAGRKGRLFLYEIYEDEAAARAHTELPHYQSYSVKTADMIASKTIERWALISDTP